MGTDKMTPTVVQLEVQDLVRMLAKDIAREVTSELKTQDILPLQERVTSLEARVEDEITRVHNRISKCQSEHGEPATKETAETVLTIARWKGALDAIWKIGVVLWCAVQIFMKVAHL